MVDECIFIYKDTNHKCRRIPRRGEKFCAAHRSPRRRRLPGEESEAFLERIFAYRDQLFAMDTDDLLYVTTGALAAVHDLIMRKSSQQDRAAFLRASTAAGIAADRLAESFAAYRADPRTLAQNAARSAAPAPQQPLSPPVPIDQAAWNEIGAELAQPLSREQLNAVIDRMITLTNPNGLTDSTLPSNG